MSGARELVAWTNHPSVDFPELNEVRENIQKGFIGVSGCGHGSALIHLFSARIGSGNESLVHLLIDKQADVNARNSDRKTPLMIAAENNNVAMTRLLLDNGAKINLQDRRNETALHKAVSHQMEIHQWRNSTELVNLLLARGVEWGVRTRIFGCMPLDYAVAANNIEGSLILLQRGADVNHQESLGETALHIAIRCGHLEQVRLLTDNGARIDRILNHAISHRTKLGNSDMSRRDTALAIIKLLVDKGAPVNYQSEVGWPTPLIMAIISGDADVVRLLLRAGANVKAKDAFGHSAMYHAKRSNFAVLGLVEEANKSVESSPRWYQMRRT